MGLPIDDAFEDMRAGDGAHLADLENLANLGGTENGLSSLRCQHALEGSTHLIHSLVDDVVHADVHSVSLGMLPGVGVGAHTEANDDRAGRPGEQHVFFVDGPYRPMDDLDLHLVGP